MPPFPSGTASGLIMQKGDNPPAYAGRKLTALDGYFGVFILTKKQLLSCLFLI